MIIWRKGRSLHSETNKVPSRLPKKQNEIILKFLEAKKITTQNMQGVQVAAATALKKVHKSHFTVAVLRRASTANVGFVQVLMTSSASKSS